MTLEPTSAAIIQLAWARRLGGLDDDAFASAAARLTASAVDPGGEPGNRITRVDDSARALVFLRLFGVSALVGGPQWALDAAAPIPDTELAQHVTLLTITRSHGGHGLGGSSALFFADDLPLKQPSDELTVSQGNPPKQSAWRDYARRMTSMKSGCKARASLHYHAPPRRGPAYARGLRSLRRVGRHPGQHGRPGCASLATTRRGHLAASIAAHEALASG